jgi:hypothetical protein
MNSSINLLRGRVYEAMENRSLASECFREALRSDVFCYEAYECLTAHHMLSAQEGIVPARIFVDYRSMLVLLQKWNCCHPSHLNLSARMMNKNLFEIFMSSGWRKYVSCQNVRFLLFSLIIYFCSTVNLGNPVCLLLYSIWVVIWTSLCMKQNNIITILIFENVTKLLLRELFCFPLYLFYLCNWYRDVIDF